MINIRYCRKCGEAYDVGTNRDICPKCRGELNKKRKTGVNKKRR